MNKKGFTLIELLAVIAILGILVLIAAPKFLGYSEKAQLARIKHDVKVMEVEIQSVMLTDPLEVPNYEDNKKDLKELIIKKQLFEKQGLAKSLEKSQPMKKFTMNNIDSDNPHPKVGVGGELYQINSYENYKIIPEEKKKKIRTRLDGTFYVNDTGKVYYEPEKPIHFSIGVIGDHFTDEDLANQSCSAPEPVDYDFDHLTGTIVKYSGKEQYLTIPPQFKVDGKCWTVKIIGKGAFSKMVPPIKNVIIPPTVETIEEDAFEGNEIEDVVIPPSVNKIENNAFGDNPIKNVLVQKPEKDIEIGENAFPPNVEPEFSAPKPEDVGLDAELSPSGGAVITGPSQPNDPGDETNPGDETDPENEPSIPGGVLVIPPKVIIDGEEVPVEEIQEGAFQGEGLIEVHLPDTIERIEDYAFAGNQLIGITIPNSVKFIGTYAFAYNELTNEKGETKPTIAYINFKGNEQIQLLNTRTGDIESNGTKINPLYGSQMLDAIWIDSRSEVDPEPTYPIIHPNGDKEYEDSTIKKPDGTIIHPDGSIEKNGTITKPDGTITKPDGTIIHPDGSIEKDGTITKPDGTITKPDGTVIKPDGTTHYPNGDIKDKDGNLWIKQPDGNLVRPDGSVMLLDGTVIPVTSESSFTWVEHSDGYTATGKSRIGYYKYTGTGQSTVVIPYVINGTPMTSYFRMFSGTGTGADVTKVISTNDKVTDMTYMFYGSKATSLDLSSFDTSNVNNMRSMFRDSQATTLDLSSFNTSKVTDMDSMFFGSKATSLDLSSFNTSKVTNMSWMLRTSKATTGYAKTQADADKFNASSNKPSTLKFTVKQ